MKLGGTSPRRWTPGALRLSIADRVRTLRLLRRALEVPMSKQLPKVVSFASTVAAEHSAPDPARVLGGRPVLTTHNHYADPAQQFFSGVWSSTEGKWRVSYAEHEFCSLLEGRVRLVSDDGSVSEFAAGDSFVIPAGFSGTWETLATCRKLYVIYVPPAQKPKRRRGAAAMKSKSVRRHKK
jgi:uncharacterized cupin superfamily protein